jgi:hypothetical protein
LALVAKDALPQDATDTLANRLIQMRGQVDQLQNELNLKREEHKNRMTYLTAQQAETEASRDREALRVRQLEQELEQMKEQVATAGATSETLTPVVLQYVDALRLDVQRGFPFKVGERMAELDEIETQLNSGVITAHRAFNRLWAFVEDELRITRGTPLYAVDPTCRARTCWSTSPKLGNAMMYFRTRDLQYGRAVETPQGWRWCWKPRPTRNWSPGCSIPAQADPPGLFHAAQCLAAGQEASS